MSQKILITGGTGFIGKTLCDALLKQGHTLYILTRGQTFNPEGNHQKIYFDNLNEIQNIEIDLLINLAGEPIAQRWTESVKKKIHESRISMTKALVDFIKGKKIKPTVFISASAVGYYGVSPHEIFTEERAPLVTDTTFSAQLCQAWEREAFHMSALGIRTVVLRIGPVLAKDGGILAKLLPSFSWGLGGQMGEGSQWLSWIDREDLIQLILFVVAQEKISGPINATSPYPVTNRAFCMALADTLHRPFFLKTPSSILKLIFGQMAEEIMLNGQKVLPSKALDSGFEFSYPTLQGSLLKIFRS